MIWTLFFSFCVAVSGSLGGVVSDVNSNALDWKPKNSGEDENGKQNNFKEDTDNQHEGSGEGGSENPPDRRLEQDKLPFTLGEDRDDLTLRITAKCPQSWNYTYYVGGSSPWLSSDPSLSALLPMVQVSNDTWQFDIKYKSGLAGYSCRNCLGDGIIRTGDNLHITIFAMKGEDLIPMKGIMTKVKFPISDTSSFFADPPGVTIVPNFDNPHGQVESITVVHPLLGERNIGIYLPPDFYNPYKQFPVTIIIDAKQAYIEQFRPVLDGWVTSEVPQTVIIGFGDWKGESLEEQNTDRRNLLGPVPGDGQKCKSGSFANLCNGCLNVENMTNSIYWGCHDITREGGGADQLLDLLLGKVVPQVVEKWPGRLMTDKEHMAVIGVNMGGLFACHAAWTRPQEVSRAACQSPTFYWPRKFRTEVGDWELEFNFINQTLSDPKYSINRPPQKILLDVGGDEWWRVVEGTIAVANQLENHPAFYKDQNLWLQVYPGKSDTTLFFLEKLWNVLKMIWN